MKYFSKNSYLYEQKLFYDIFFSLFWWDEMKCSYAFPTDLCETRTKWVIFFMQNSRNIFFRFNVKSLLLFKMERILKETEGKAKKAWGDSFVNIVKLKIRKLKHQPYFFLICFSHRGKGFLDTLIFDEMLSQFGYFGFLLTLENFACQRIGQ